MNQYAWLRLCDRSEHFQHKRSYLLWASDSGPRLLVFERKRPHIADDGKRAGEDLHQFLPSDQPIFRDVRDVFGRSCLTLKRLIRSIDAAQYAYR